MPTVVPRVHLFPGTPRPNPTPDPPSRRRHSLISTVDTHVETGILVHIAELQSSINDELLALETCRQSCRLAKIERFVVM